MNIRVVKGDITTFKGDVIVNAANVMLTPTGGLTAAIHRAAGPEMTKACENVSIYPFTGRRCEPGSFHQTEGFGLSVNYVLHAVGPKWQGGTCGELNELRELYERIMSRCFSYGDKKIAFPSISTGHHGIPVEQASRVAIYSIGRMLLDYPDFSVTIYTYSESDFQVYQQTLKKAKVILSNLPEWIIHINGTAAKEGGLSRCERVAFECRNAGEIGKFETTYTVDCFPYFTIQTKLNGEKFEAGHKHSYMAWTGCVHADSSRVWRYIPAEIPFVVMLNGEFWKRMRKEEIQEMVGNAEAFFVVTDPRFLFAAMAALCDKKEAVNAVLNVDPSWYEAAHVLARYRLMTFPPVFSTSFSEGFDCYPWLEKIRKDMLAHGASFLEYALKTKSHKDENNVATICEAARKLKNTCVSLLANEKSEDGSFEPTRNSQELRDMLFGALGAMVHVENLIRKALGHSIHNKCMEDMTDNAEQEGCGVKYGADFSESVRLAVCDARRLLHSVNELLDKELLTRFMKEEHGHATICEIHHVLSCGQMQIDAKWGK